LLFFPSGQVQVYVCGNVVLLTANFFDVVKFTILTPNYHYYPDVDSRSQLSV